MTRDGYCPFLDKMEGRYNRVSSEVSARNLRKKLKEFGLERMLQQSKAGPMHAFSSCKFNILLSELQTVFVVGILFRTYEEDVTCACFCL